MRMHSTYILACSRSSHSHLCCETSLRAHHGLQQPPTAQRYQLPFISIPWSLSDNLSLATKLLTPPWKLELFFLFTPLFMDPNQSLHSSAATVAFHSFCRPDPTLGWRPLPHTQALSTVTGNEPLLYFCQSPSAKLLYPRASCTCPSEISSNNRASRVPTVVAMGDDLYLPDAAHSSTKEQDHTFALKYSAAPNYVVTYTCHP